MMSKRLDIYYGLGRREVPYLIVALTYIPVVTAICLIYMSIAAFVIFPAAKARTAFTGRKYWLCTSIPCLRRHAANRPRCASIVGFPLRFVGAIISAMVVLALDMVVWMIMMFVFVPIYLIIMLGSPLARVFACHRTGCNWCLQRKHALALSQSVKALGRSAPDRTITAMAQNPYLSEEEVRTVLESVE